MTRKSSKPAKNGPKTAKTDLLTWEALRLWLKKEGLGDFGPDAYKAWRKESPPIPVAKPATKKGEAHLYHPIAVSNWLRARRNRVKAWAPVTAEIVEKGRKRKLAPIDNRAGLEKALDELSPPTVPTSASKLRDRDPEPPPPPDDDDSGDEFDHPALKLAHYKALNEKLKYLTAKKSLLPIGEVKPALERAFANVKSRILALPAVLSPDLAAESNPARIQKLLRDAIREALRDLAVNGVLRDEPDNRDGELGGEDDDASSGPDSESVGGPSSVPIA